MLYLILIIFILLFGLMVFYLLNKVNKSYFIQKIKYKKLIILLELIIVGIFMFINMVNTMIVIIHLFFIDIFINFIYFIIKKIKNIQIKYNITLIISVLITTIYMIYGYYNVNNIKQTNYTLFTNKIESDFKIVQISDSHLGTTMSGKDLEKYVLKINDLKPDIVVITGDFIDDDTSYKDFIDGTKALGLLNTKYGVYFVYGNHDNGYFNRRSYNESNIKEELSKNNVIILEDDIVNITDDIVLIGRKDKHISNRLSMDELVKNIDKNKYIITLDHQPTDFKNQENKVDLVLSGHTHGGQFIPIGKISVLLGINDGYYGLSKKDNTNYIISSGISNWAFKFKTGCISEYVVIDIKKGSEL